MTRSTGKELPFGPIMASLDGRRRAAFRYAQHSGYVTKGWGWAARSLLVVTPPVSPNHPTACEIKNEWEVSFPNLHAGAHMRGVPKYFFFACTMASP